MKIWGNNPIEGDVPTRAGTARDTIRHSMAQQILIKSSRVKTHRDTFRHGEQYDVRGGEDTPWQGNFITRMYVSATKRSLNVWHCDDWNECPGSFRN